MITAETMDVFEGAAFLSIHPDTLKAFARAGDVPAYRPGRKLVFLRSELLDFLKSKKYQCHSTSAKTQRITIADSRSAVRKLDALLGPVTEEKRPSLKIVSAATPGGR